MAKKPSNKSGANTPNMTAPKEMSILKESQKDTEFKQSLPNESQEPMLSTDIQKGLNEEQLAQFELFKTQYQTALKSLEDLYFENQKTQKEFDQKFTDLEKDKQSLANDKQNFENQKSEQEQQIANQEKQLKKEKANQD